MGPGLVLWKLSEGQARSILEGSLDEAELKSGLKEHVWALGQWRKAAGHSQLGSVSLGTLKKGGWTFWP